MEREQVVEILKILKIAYPRFYADLSKTDAENTIALWLDYFKDDNPQLVAIAVKTLISQLKFPPTIADIKEQMYKLTNNQDTAIEAWEEAYKMICKGGYMTKEEFEKHSPLVKRFFGSVDQLRAYATNEDFNFDVVRSNFLKQYDELAKREKQQELLPQQMQNYINTIAKKMSIQSIEEGAE